VQPAALKTLAEDLRLLASALRFMDSFRGSAAALTSQGGIEHPAMKVGSYLDAWLIQFRCTNIEQPGRH